MNSSKSRSANTSSRPSRSSMATSKKRQACSASAGPSSTANLRSRGRSSAGFCFSYRAVGRLRFPAPPKPAATRVFQSEMWRFKDWPVSPWLPDHSCVYRPSPGSSWGSPDQTCRSLCRCQSFACEIVAGKNLERRWPLLSKRNTAILGPTPYSYPFFPVRSDLSDLVEIVSYYREHSQWLRESPGAVVRSQSL